MQNFGLGPEDIKAQLDKLAETDSNVKAAIELVDYPGERVNPQGLNTFVRVIMGQQLSVKAAASIWARVQALVGEDADASAYAAQSDEALREAGVSRQKIKYLRSLCETIESGVLDIAALPHMDDEEAIKAITSVKGLGVWSAHMYLMFSLGRTDIWPVGDLAVRVGIGRIVGLEERPTEKEAEKLGERWKPYRSVMALLSWHYYSNAPF
ncbi:DNA-3-methyladenine glycosylase [Kordiimonas sp. SCSIO 12603]|uniref:DNA-3-methyladenine glycosylase family protein n=1 Tax=Kordiimonas sp. SCSIO 12603 TaxID=2829596 RepID=UPI002102D279|nr:DNA-3-methyladenine glycosylase 2 family protein [Kordiimonas sp. SCSIO 12603]